MSLSLLGTRAPWCILVAFGRSAVQAGRCQPGCLLCHQCLRGNPFLPSDWGGDFWGPQLPISSVLGLVRHKKALRLEWVELRWCLAPQAEVPPKRAL